RAWRFRNFWYQSAHSYSTSSKRRLRSRTWSLSSGSVFDLKGHIRYAACGGSPWGARTVLFFLRPVKGGLTFWDRAPHLSCRSLGPEPAVDPAGAPCGSSQPPRESVGPADHLVPLDHASKWIGSVPSRPPHRPPQRSHVAPRYASSLADAARSNARPSWCMLCPGGAAGYGE